MRIDLDKAYACYKADAQLHRDEFAEALLQVTKRMVRSFCARQNASTFDKLEDAVGETLLKVWRRVEAPSLIHDINAYVTTVAQHCVADIFCAKRLAKESRLVEETLSEEAQIIEPGTDVLGISRLPPEEHTILQMKADGLTQTEIGQALGIPQRTVSWKLKKIKTLLLKTPPKPVSCL